MGPHSGEHQALTITLQMGPDGHVLTFPVNHGKILNIVGFRTTKESWPDSNRLTRPAKREDALRDFAGYGSNVTELLKLTKPDLDIVGHTGNAIVVEQQLTVTQWAIFDLGDHPVPTMYKGRVCITGDAAHATSPHHGAGAGFCIEDSAVLAELLSFDQVHLVSDLETVFATFNDRRKERGQWLVQSSRWIGDCYEWRAEGIGRDFAKIEREINERNGQIADVDVEQWCREAREDLAGRLH